MGVWVCGEGRGWCGIWEWECGCGGWLWGVLICQRVRTVHIPFYYRIHTLLSSPCSLALLPILPLPLSSPPTLPALPQVLYKSPVSIVDNPKINQWLSLVEKEMRLNLATLLAQAVEDISKFSTETLQAEEYILWVDRYQAQLVVLASQITWSTGVEDALQTLQNNPPPPGAELGPLLEVLRVIEATLNVLADSVLHEQPPVRRKKLEHLVRKGGCGVKVRESVVRAGVV